MQVFSDRWRALFWKSFFFVYLAASLVAFFAQEADRRSYAMDISRYERENANLRAMRERVKKYVLKHLGKVVEQDIFTDEELQYLGRGRISHFGGPDDETIPRYVKIGKKKVPSRTAITQEIAHNLNPNDYYCAYKWDYDEHPPDYLKQCRVLVRYKNREVVTRIVDWGPKKRLIDVSPATMQALGCETDDHVEAFLIHPPESSNS